MHSAWYRLPGDEEPRPEEQVPQKGRGRGRGAGRGRPRGRGRGSAQKAPEPYSDPASAAAPYSVHAMGHYPYMQASHAHPYYNAIGMESMQPHWYASHHAQSPYGHPHYPAPHAPGYPYPTRHHASGHLPHHHHMAGAQREHYQQYMNTSPMHVAPTATAHRGSHSASPAYHHVPYMYPGYLHNENQRAHHQQADMPSVQNVDNLPSRQSTTTQAQPQVTQVLNHPQHHFPSNTTNLQHESTTREYLSLARTTESQKTPTVAAVPQRTLAETAAFLNHPQLTHQQIKDSSRIYPAQRTQTNCVQLPQTPIEEETDINRIICLDSPEPYEPQPNKNLNKPTPPQLSGREMQVFNPRHEIKATYDNPIIPASMPDFRKYSELTVTVAEEPPPAHQVVKQTYPDLYTPPLAHQAPTHTPTRPQSARTHAIPLPSPPQAHQASVPQSHVKELLAISRQQREKKKAAVSQYSHNDVSTSRAKRQPSRRKANNAPQTDNDVICASHSVYDPDKFVGEAQITYQPSTETFATEQVVYQPKTDMFTKEQILYQPRTNMISKTQVVYQPRTEFIAAAEAVYKSDGVAARQMVIQPQSGVMQTAEAVYQTQDNRLTARETIYQSSKDKSKRSQRGSTSQNRAQCHTHTATIALHQPTPSQAEWQATQNEQLDENAPNVASPILRNILSNELAQSESEATERTFPTIQEYLQEKRHQAACTESNPATSNPETPNPSLRQARKRKTAPAPPNETEHLQHLQHLTEAELTTLLAQAAAAPPSADGAAANLPAIVALNMALHNLTNNYQVIIRNLINVIMSGQR